MSVGTSLNKDSIFLKAQSWSSKGNAINVTDYGVDSKNSIP